MGKYYLKIVGIILLMLILISMFMPDDAYAQVPRTRVNGNIIQVATDDQQPIVINNDVLIPLRSTMEALGYTVEWNLSTQTVTLIHSVRARTIRAEIGSYYILVGEEQIRLDAPMRIMGNRTMIMLSTLPAITEVRTRWDQLIQIADVQWSPSTWPVNSSNWPEHLPRHVSGSLVLMPEDNLSGVVDLSISPQFRYAFYIIPGEIMDMVRGGDRSRYDWLRNEGRELQDQMLLMHFVRYFNISRADFDTVIERKREAGLRWGVDFATEWDELPNADIIFTFDDDIVRYFYRRE